MNRLLNEELFPGIKRIAQAGPLISFKIQTIGKTMRQIRENGVGDIPYLLNLEEEIKRCNTSLKHVIIVSDSEPVAVKAAKYMLENDVDIMAEHSCLLYNKNEKNDPYGVFEDEVTGMESVFGTEDELKVVKFVSYELNNAVPVNMYLQMLEETTADAILYEGMLENTKNLEDRVNAILADQRSRKYIWITPETISKKWVTELRMEHDFAMVQLKTVPKTYYYDIFEQLLSCTEYTLKEGLSKEEVVNHIMKLRGNSFTEEDMDWIIEKAVHNKNHFGKGSSTLSIEDFSINDKTEESALTRLNKMPGLRKVKEMVEEHTALLLESRRNEKLKDIHGNMIFYGNPGTGKTTCAKLLAEIMADYGVSNANFVEATRADLIGQYVGSTAMKVASVFEKARGGVLFVDEAGFFLNTGSGGYLNEAIKEFVRFMENYPDVTVIFAMYEKEAEGFLKLDEGLASRISRMVEFNDYSKKELQEIFLHMAKNNGYQVAKGALAPVMQYLDSLKESKKFGNARDVRKIFESAIITHSVRIMKESAGNENELSSGDIRRGIERLDKTPKRMRDFGFRYGAVEKL